MKNPTGKRAQKRSFCAAAVILAATMAIFGIAFAGLPVDEATLPVYQSVSDISAPVNTSFYTKTATEDFYLERQWNIDDTNLDVVWNMFRERIADTSSPVFVVVMEECIDLDHADLDGSFYQIGTDPDTGEAYIGAYLDDSIPGQGMSPLKKSDWKTKIVAPDSSDYARFFHGSHVAGIVGARHNGIGIAGCSPNAYIIPVFTGGVYGEATAFNWVVDELYGILETATGSAPRIIIQRAWGSTITDPLDSFTVTEHFNAYKKASDAGILVVHGAGNAARNLYDGTWEEAGEEVTVIPSCGGILAENFIAVAAHGVGGRLHPTTNYSTSGTEAQVHLSAPGWKIVSLGRNGEYFVDSGTSMAAPHVSGTAALLWQLFPDATASEIKALVLEGAAVSNSRPVLPHNGETAETIGGYVRTGYLDAASSVRVSKQVLGTDRGLDIDIPVKDIVISPSAYNIIEDDTAVMTVEKILPLTADDKTVNFVSSNPSAAWITEADGEYTIHTSVVDDDTQVTIYAEAEDGYGVKSNTVEITVTKRTIAVTGLSFKQNGTVIVSGETVAVKAGDQVTLEPVVAPSDATVEDSDFAWTVEPFVEKTVTGRNLSFTPAETGEYVVELSVSTESGTVIAGCTVSVSAPPVTGISVSESHGYPTNTLILPNNSTITLSATVTPLDADYTPSDIHWTAVSGNPLLSATTGGSISVLLRYAGIVTVRATVGSFSSEYSLEVMEPDPDPIDPDPVDPDPVDPDPVDPDPVDPDPVDPDPVDPDPVDPDPVDPDPVDPDPVDPDPVDPDPVDPDPVDPDPVDPDPVDPDPVDPDPVDPDPVDPDPVDPDPVDPDPVDPPASSGGGGGCNTGPGSGIALLLMGVFPALIRRKK